MPEQTLIGKIIKLRPEGHGLILVEGSDYTLYPFSFDKISTYRGESTKELTQFGPDGLKVGVLIKFNLKREIESKSGLPCWIVDKIFPLVFKEPPKMIW